MAKKKRKKISEAARARAKSLVCIFCGGQRPTTTAEHCPPQGMFHGRASPEGFLFPACAECNNGSSDADTFISLLARLDPMEERSDKDGRLGGLIKNVINQFPEDSEAMMPTATEARSMNRQMGIVPGPGQTHQDVCGIFVVEGAKDSIATIAGKLAKALYFTHTGLVFPADGCLILYYATNAEIADPARKEAYQPLLDVPGEALPLVRNGRRLNDQFAYKFSRHCDGAFMVVAVFGSAFMVTIAGHPKPNVLEPALLHLCDGRRFRILQSGVVPPPAQQTRSYERRYLARMVRWPFRPFAFRVKSASYPQWF